MGECGISQALSPRCVFIILGNKHTGRDCGVDMFITLETFITLDMFITLGNKHTGNKKFHKPTHTKYASINRHEQEIILLWKPQFLRE